MTENPSENEEQRQARIRAMIEADKNARRRAPPPPRPQIAIEMGTIVWGVFWGMWAFSLTAGFVYGIIQAFSYHR